MKNILTIILIVWSLITYGQDKYSYVDFNKLSEVEGTEFVIASIENREKMGRNKNSYLLFINTQTGQANQVEFPNGGYIDKIEQVKIDALDINKIIVSARTIDLNGKKGINWNDPKQIIILSTNGKERNQITDNNLFVRTWTINKQSGTIVIAGHYDTNKNGKYDKTDKNEIRIYDLKTLKLLNKI